MIAFDYLKSIIGTLPFGPAWDAEEGTTAYKIYDSWSQEFFKIDNKATMLAEEADPRITYELLYDYERIFGLPTACTANINQTVGHRQQALVAQMTSSGGQSIAYFIDIALSAGYAITITEFKPFSVGGTVADSIWGRDWAYAWKVNSSLTSPNTAFRVTSPVSVPLGAWGNQLLECIMTRYKPAHTHIIFAYA